LLIQRCKKQRRQRNFFAEGLIRPDERPIWPTNDVNLTLFTRNGFPFMLVIALMNRLKCYGICLGIVLSTHTFAQNKLSVTFCPLAAADFISFQTIQGGIEYRFTPALSWYNEFGVEYIRSFISLPDTTILRPHGIKAKTEIRYYFPGSGRRSVFSRGHYIALNAFLTSDTHNTDVHYLYNRDTSLPREDAFGVRKKVWGLNLVYGRQQMIGKRFGLDLYLGLGLRFRYITTVGRQFDYNRDYLEMPIDYNIPAERAQTEAKGGFSMAPNLTAGIRVFYRL
jgi:hypothetical protein